jgi:hypothetical protein
MTSWAALDAELDRWAEAGRRATLWWRDDDAVAATPQLERLLLTARRRDGEPVPLCLAVIPAAADSGLAATVAAQKRLSVLQHGFAHRNHAPPGEKKAELGAHRPVAAILDELSAGRDRLRQMFAAAFLPVLVPPWNRMASPVRDGLGRIGLRGYSAYGARAPGERGVVNAHVDIVAWHQGRGFLGGPAALGLLIGHLSARREGRADAEEPTGLLTHHLVHDEGCWEFLTDLLHLLEGRREVRWLAGADIFGQTGAVAPATSMSA